MHTVQKCEFLKVLTPCPVLIFFIFDVFVLTLVYCSIDLNPRAAILGDLSSYDKSKFLKFLETPLNMPLHLYSISGAVD